MSINEVVKSTSASHQIQAKNANAWTPNKQKSYETPFSILSRSCSTVTGVVFLRTTCDILPRRVEPATRARQQSFFLLFLEILIQCVSVKFRSSEKSGYGCDEIDSQEGELRPETDDAEEGKIDHDTIDKGGYDGWGANLCGNGVLS